MTQERFDVPLWEKTVCARGMGSIVGASYNFNLKIVTVKLLDFNISVTFPSLGVWIWLSVWAIDFAVAICCRIVLVSGDRWSSSSSNSDTSSHYDSAFFVLSPLLSLQMVWELVIAIQFILKNRRRWIFRLVFSFHEKINQFTCKYKKCH